MSSTKTTHGEDNFYRVRGCLSFIERASSEREHFNESFACELIKQVSPQIVKTIGTDLQKMKRRHIYITFPRSAYLYQNSWYMELHIAGPTVGASGKHSYIWIRCFSNPDSGIIIDPWAEPDSINLNFEIIYEVPVEVVVKSNEFFLRQAEMAKTSKEKEEYINYYKESIQRTKYDEWVEYFQVVFETRPLDKISPELWKRFFE